MRRKRCSECKTGEVQFMARKSENAAVLYICTACVDKYRRQGYLIVSYHRE